MVVESPIRKCATPGSPEVRIWETGDDLQTVSLPTTEEIQAQVQSQVFDLDDEFFRCGGCGHDDLKGSRLQRIVKNLAVVLAGPGP